MVEVELKKSTSKGKKYMMIFYQNGKKIRTTHFGSAGMSDFTKNKDPKRKKLYLDRHRANENWNDYKSAGSLSRWVLWNKPTIEASYKSYKSRFNLTKHY